MNDQKPLRLRKRAEFLAVRAGEKRRGGFFLLEVKEREDRKGPPRVGFTVTKKNGNAVIRNRIKRRLKEAVRVNVAGDMAPGTDYVIVARRDALDAPFADLSRELSKRVSKKYQTGDPIMETNRNFFITIALSVVILGLWQVFYMGPKIEAERQQAQIEATRQAQTKAAGQPATPAGTPANNLPASTPAAPGANIPGQ
eukprot:gene26434-31785_t